MMRKFNEYTKRSFTGRMWRSGHETISYSACTIEGGHLLELGTVQVAYTVHVVWSLLNSHLWKGPVSCEGGD